MTGFPGFFFLWYLFPYFPITFPLHVSSQTCFPVKNFGIPHLFRCRDLALHELFAIYGRDALGVKNREWGRPRGLVQKWGRVPEFWPWKNRENDDEPCNGRFFLISGAKPTKPLLLIQELWRKQKYGNQFQMVLGKDIAPLPKWRGLWHNRNAYNGYFQYLLNLLMDWQKPPQMGKKTLQLLTGNMQTKHHRTSPKQKIPTTSTRRNKQIGWS